MKHNFSISFVLPMFNERDNIEDTIRKIKSVAEELTSDYEIVIVDDASSDGCRDIVRTLAEQDDTIRLFRLERNSKFGGAFAKGLVEARKDIILYTDSDMPVRTKDIQESIFLIADVDIVTGYSKVKKGDTVGRKIISSVYNFAIQILFGLNIKDINSGYKIIKRDVVDDIEFVSRSPFVDVELFLHARRKGCKVHQFGLVFHPRSGGKSYISRFPVLWATFIDMLKVKLLFLKKGS